jgi:diaminopimelate decarboxylase/aspartate kinase
MIVQKYGGSSITKVGFEVIKKQIEENNRLIIVLSALSGTTGKLIKFTEIYQIKIIEEIIENHKKFIFELELKDDCLNILFNDLLSMSNLLILDYNNKKLKSSIIGFGEYLSTHILHNYLDEKYFLADARKFIKTNEVHNAIFMTSIFYCDAEIIKKIIKNNLIIIVQGFNGSTCDNKHAIMSRGGSDTTSALVANAINADRLEIWTDVNGIYNADPRLITDAKLIKNIDYTITKEITAIGAKVLHPYCIAPCEDKNIPIVIKNTYNNNLINTIINNKKNDNYKLLIKKDSNTFFKICSINMWNQSGFVADIFQIFSKHKINIDLISTSEFNITCTTNDYLLDKTIENIENELSKKYNITIYKNCSIISLLCNDILKSNCFNQTFSNFIKKIDEELYNSILMTHLSSNGLTISFVITEDKSIEFYTKFYLKIFN